MKILVDSCCDLSAELRARTKAAVAPLTITIDGEDFVDDGSVDIPSYLAKMRASKETPRSACPSPDAYAGDIASAQDACFVVTLSSKLSGTYQSAVLAAEGRRQARCRAGEGNPPGHARSRV